MVMWKTRIAQHVNTGGLAYEVPERKQGFYKELD